MKALFKSLSIFLIGFFSCYVLCIGYFRNYQVENSLKNFYEKKEIFTGALNRGEWLLANMAFRDLRELNPNELKVEDLNFSDFIISGVLGFDAKVLISKEERDRDLSFYENQIPMEKRIK